MLPMTEHTLILGGAKSGKSTLALNLAEQGFGVYLVERERELGAERDVAPESRALSLVAEAIDLVRPSRPGRRPMPT